MIRRGTKVRYKGPKELGYNADGTGKVFTVIHKQYNHITVSFPYRWTSCKGNPIHYDVVSLPISDFTEIVKGATT